MNIIYEGLGFPVKLIGVKTRTFRGEVLPDINHRELEDKVFQILLWMHAKMTGPQLAFVRGYMGLSQKAFANCLGIKTHSTVSTWELKNGITGMTHATEVVIRLLMAEYIHNEQFAPKFREFLNLADEIKDLELEVA
jgi:DNA-binding transcriptional regulator YiaG